MRLGRMPRPLTAAVSAHRGLVIGRVQVGRRDRARVARAMRTPLDKVAQDRSAQDRAAQDKAAPGRVAPGRVVKDTVAQVGMTLGRAVAAHKELGTRAGRPGLLGTQAD